MEAISGLRTMKIDSIVDLLSSVFPVFKKWSLILKKQNFAQAKIKGQIGLLLQTKKVLLVELQTILVKLISERRVMNILKKKILARPWAEKRLVTVLQKCSQVPSGTLDISNCVEILMQKFVDPKLKQKMTSFKILPGSAGTGKNKSKKMAAAQRKKFIQLERYFGGVSNISLLEKSKMSKTVAIIVGQQDEMNAIRECEKLGIKMFHLVDTNSNPILANHFVPANENSHHSVKFILGKFLKHIRLAQKLRLRLKSAKLMAKRRTAFPLRGKAPAL
jgi:hypothetical protein